MSGHSLVHVRRRAILKLDRLVSSAQAISTPAHNADHMRCLSLAVEASNTWADFLRRYYIASALAGWTSSNQRLSAATHFISEHDAITFAVHTIKPHLTGSGPWTSRDEPNWLDPGNVSTLLHALGCANEAQFHAAISLGGTAHQDLLTYRNFLAHRNRATALKVRSLARKYRINGLIEPVEIPLQLPIRKSYSLLLWWLYDLQTMVSLMPD